MTENRRLKITKNILWLLTGIGTSAAISRLINGLGVTTALTDTTSWGLWIGFDVMGGVALAAGGFVIAGVVYIFHIERFRPLLRPAVLTAFLGYLAVIIGLIFDIGRPWMIWSAMINWQIHSPLFEVAWCVMLYTTVLALEFLPVVLEKFSWSGKILAIFKKVTIPLVILGIMLSTMHQSTLGTLFVLMPFRVHPLWYSMWLPLLFFVSAIVLGMSMVICESMVSGWLFKRNLEKDLLESVAKLAGYVLIFYLFLVFANLAYYGKLDLLFDGSWVSFLYWFELLLSTIIPIILFSFSKFRSSTRGLATGAGLVVLGVVLNRINLAIVSMINTTGSDYFPSWMEITITLAIVSAAVLAFFFFIENFNVYESKSQLMDSGEDLNKPVFDKSSGVWLGSSFIKNTSVYFLFFLFGAGISFALMPDGAVHGAAPEKTPVFRARGVKSIIIDGNRNNQAVIFYHEKHISENGKNDSCVKCHHMRKPMDEITPCSECHKDMFLKTSIFDHSFHEKKLGENMSCEKCHQKGQSKGAETVKQCEGCHTKMIPEGALIPVKSKGPDRLKFAVGYEDAMHGLCIECHKEKALEYIEKRASSGSNQSTQQENSNKERLHYCATCHKELHFTKDPIPEIIVPEKGKNEIHVLLGGD